MQYHYAVCILVLTNLLCTLLLVELMAFNQSTFIVGEDDRQALLVLSLNYPSSSDITVQVFTSDGSASMC